MLSQYLMQLFHSHKFMEEAIPKVTPEMKAKGLKWRRIQDEFFQVCDFCNGNCGQCGLTDRVGNIPFDMDHMIEEFKDQGKYRK